MCACVYGVYVSMYMVGYQFALDSKRIALSFIKLSTGKAKSNIGVLYKMICITWNTPGTNHIDSWNHVHHEFLI